MCSRKRDGSAGLAKQINSYTETSEGNFKTGGIKGDEGNIAILLFLYLLQGIPLGLMQAIPIILTNSGISYKQQAKFSLVNWPFSLKLLWAPVIDCVFWRKLGRRKSWLVPTQYLIGILLVMLSSCVQDWLGSDGSEAKMELLTISFFCINFLAATQDIAVDGWALTMLKRHNVGYASTCNSVGQTAGYFLGYVSFLALESAEFCNSYLRSVPLEHGIVTLPGFLRFWGWIFIVTTTLIWWLKTENSGSVGKTVSIADSYKLLLEIIKLKPIRLLAAILLTVKIGLSACDAVTGLKLVEAGIPKEKMALFGLPLVPLQVFLPLLLSRYITGSNPMNVFLIAYPYRLLCGVLFSIFVAITPYFVVNHELPITYCVFLLIIYCFHQVTSNSMFVAQMAFFAKVSDPAVGGTYMTLLNTLANVGGTWPQTLALWCVDLLTFKGCSNAEGLSCSNATEIEMCERGKGTCVTKIDGYYIESVLCTIIGFLWLMWGRKSIKRLRSFGMTAFSLKKLHPARDNCLALFWHVLAACLSRWKTKLLRAHQQHDLLDSLPALCCHL